jgi:hypothetical protein
MELSVTLLRCQQAELVAMFAGSWKSFPDGIVTDF